MHAQRTEGHSGVIPRHSVHLARWHGTNIKSFWAKRFLLGVGQFRGTNRYNLVLANMLLQLEASRPSVPVPLL